MQIKDRIFVLSGASSGLGLATARNLYNQGGFIAMLDIDEASGDDARKEIGTDRTRVFETDVTESESIEAAITGVVAWAKETGKTIGGIISAAGVGNPALLVDRNNEPAPMSAIDFVLNINLRGTLDLVRQCLPHMTTTKPEGPDGERGVIILVSSSAAFEGQMGQVSYAASKGAIRSLTLPLARDLAQYGIRVVTIAPSMFETKMTSMLSDKVKKSLERVMEWPKRAGKPHEFAELVRHSIENPMLNGVVIRLDGASRMPSRL